MSASKRQAVGRRGDVALAMASAALATGCISGVHEEIVRTDVRSTGATAATKHDDRTGDRAVSTKLEGDTLVVTVTDPKECRDATSTPRDAVVTRTRTLEQPTVQTINLVAAGALAAGGIATLALTDGANCHGGDGTCTDKQRQDYVTANTAAGVGLLALAAVPAAGFVINALRARDETKREPIDPLTDDGKWKSCGTIPAAGTHVALRAGAGRQGATTDATGVARIPLARFAESVPDPGSGSLVVPRAKDDLLSLEVELREAPFYASWRTAEQARVAAAEEKRAADEKARKEREAKEERERQETNAKVERLRRDCDKSRVAACLELGALLAPDPDDTADVGLAFLDKACSLRSERGCALARTRTAALERAQSRAEQRRVAREREEAEARARRAEEAAEQRAASDPVTQGRRIVAHQLKAPGSARFADDKVVLACSSGTHITMHTYDAQNSFGAYLRGTTCAAFNLSTRKALIQPNICDSVEYTGRSRSKEQMCSYWTDLIERSKPFQVGF